MLANSVASSVASSVAHGLFRYGLCGYSPHGYGLHSYDLVTVGISPRLQAVLQQALRPAQPGLTKFSPSTARGQIKGRHSTAQRNPSAAVQEHAQSVYFQQFSEHADGKR